MSKQEDEIGQAILPGPLKEYIEAMHTCWQGWGRVCVGGGGGLDLEEAIYVHERNRAVTLLSPQTLNPQII